MKINNNKLLFNNKMNNHILIKFLNKFLKQNVKLKVTNKKKVIVT